VNISFNGCGRQTSVTAGTIFQDTRKPLSMWFRAIWWVTSQKTGTSALGLKQVLGFGGATVRRGLGCISSDERWCDLAAISCQDASRSTKRIYGGPEEGGRRALNSNLNAVT
jgi:hypothetical protein